MYTFFDSFSSNLICVSLKLFYLVYAWVNKGHKKKCYCTCYFLLSGPPVKILMSSLLYISFYFRYYHFLLFTSENMNIETKRIGQWIWEEILSCTTLPPFCLLVSTMVIVEMLRTIFLSIIANIFFLFLWKLYFKYNVIKNCLFSTIKKEYWDRGSSVLLMTQHGDISAGGLFL